MDKFGDTSQARSNHRNAGGKSFEDDQRSRFQPLGRHSQQIVPTQCRRDLRNWYGRVEFDPFIWSRQTVQIPFVFASCVILSRGVNGELQPLLGYQTQSLNQNVYTFGRIESAQESYL